MYLTLPVRRRDLAKSYIIYLLLWQTILVGSFCIGMLISYLLHDPTVNAFGDWNLRMNCTQLGILLLTMGVHNMLSGIQTSSDARRVVYNCTSIAVAYILPVCINLIAVRCLDEYTNGYGSQYLWIRLTALAVGLLFYILSIFILSKHTLNNFAKQNDIFT